MIAIKKFANYNYETSICHVVKFRPYWNYVNNWSKIKKYSWSVIDWKLFQFVQFIDYFWNGLKIRFYCTIFYRNWKMLRCQWEPKIYLPDYSMTTQLLQSKYSTNLLYPCFKKVGVYCFTSVCLSVHPSISPSIHLSVSPLSHEYFSHIFLKNYITWISEIWFINQQLFVYQTLASFYTCMTSKLKIFVTFFSGTMFNTMIS